MKKAVLDDILTEMRNLLEKDDLAGAMDIIEAMRPADQADLVAGLKLRIK